MKEAYRYVIYAYEGAYSETHAVGSTHLPYNCTNLQRPAGAVLRHVRPGAGDRAALV